MAAGEGGFSTQINGFNKNEVTEYIGKISKEKQKLESDLKASEEKLRAAVKIATEADEKVNAAKEESDKQIAELNAKLKEERKKSDELILQIDDLKRKLKNSGGKSSGGDANADKRAEEIINSANAKARQIIADAEKKAAGMSKGSASAAPAGNVDSAALMNLLKGFQTMVSGELTKLTAKASDILKTPAPAAAPAEADDTMGMSGAFFDNMDDNSSSDDMGGFGDFGGFGGMTASEPAGSMDMSASSNDIDDMAAAEVAPLDDPETPKNEMDEDFGKDLLAQSVPSSALSDAMQDMFGGAGGDLDIKGNDDSVDFDMGGGMDSDNSGSAMSDIDAMNALLGQMSASLESAGGSADNVSEAEEETSSADDNPWASLQAQLDAMEKSGNFGSDDSGNAPEPEMTTEAPAAPSADDSSIWDFGTPSDSDSSGDDDMSDDMSADLFGSF